MKYPPIKLYPKGHVQPTCECRECHYADGYNQALADCRELNAQGTEGSGVKEDWVNAYKPVGNASHCDGDVEGIEKIIELFLDATDCMPIPLNYGNKIATALVQSGLGFKHNKPKD